MTAKEKRLKNWRENMNRIKITEAVATLMIIANSVTFIICNWMALWSAAHSDWVSTWLYIAISVLNALAMQIMVWLAAATVELMEEAGENNIVNTVANYILDF